MRKSLHFLFALSFLVVGPVYAQAPQISPEGDPTVDCDTIYSLAVDPDEHPDQPFVYLLDDGVINLEPDGRITTTFRYVTQVLTREAAEQWGERSFSYSPSREELTLNWVRVLDLEGQVISEGPAQEQESLAPVAQRAPIYTDRMVRRVTLGGVAPGTIVDISWTKEVQDPLFPGDFFQGWNVSAPRLTRRSRLVVDMPESFEPRMREENLDFEATEQLRDGRRILSWHRTEIERYESEPFASLEPNEVLMRIWFAPPLTWQDVAKWYAELTAESYELTDKVREQLGDVVAEATTREDSLKALHRWVAQDFRYVSVSLGIGGYKPRLPAEVLESRFGDCKDKAVFFVAAAREMGLTAYPVLTAVMRDVQLDLPTISQFDHMIAAVKLDGDFVFTDLTSDLDPWGSIPYPLHGTTGLLIRPDGESELLTIPATPPTENVFHAVLVGEITEERTFKGNFTELRTGIQEYPLRQSFTRTLSSSEMERLIQNVANSLMQGATGADLTIFDGRDLDAEVRIAIQLEHIRPLTTAGNDFLFKLPLRNYASHRLVANLKARDERLFPIDAERVIGPIEDTWELRLTLPPGWQAQLPETVTADSPFGIYTAEYTQEGREVRVLRRITGNAGIHPPDRIAELITWLEQISEDDVDNLVLRPPGDVGR